MANTTYTTNALNATNGLGTLGLGNTGQNASINSSKDTDNKSSFGKKAFISLVAAAAVMIAGGGEKNPCQNYN